ncbi:hypothetical protein WMY93_014132 [Mugilogobius chulae]|uniref:THAP-type domain-containing protein n=1 Tax=Mugilogobius chulae TaxID=88201 RepID=A0AAW0P3M2_9GOBI
MACSAFNCSKRPSRDVNLQFFRYPHGDPERLKLWLVNVRRESWTPSSTSRLWSEHFDENQFLLSKKGKRVLKKDAVPIIFNFPAHLQKKVTPRIDLPQSTWKRTQGSHQALNSRPCEGRLEQAESCLLQRCLQASASSTSGEERGTGNCLLRDNTEILDSTSATVNVARRMDLVSVEVHLPENAITDIPGNIDILDTISEYKEAAINYISDFIVTKMKKHVTCMPCVQALIGDNLESHPFLELKSRGGLQSPSAGIVAVCQMTEKCFQRLLRSNGEITPPGRQTTTAIVTQVLGECLDKDLFPSLHCHMFDTSVESNHVHLLVKMASAWYCKIRLNHLAKQQTEKDLTTGHY